MEALVYTDAAVVTTSDHPSEEGCEQSIQYNAVSLITRRIE
jgi:hypothetical protein